MIDFLAQEPHFLDHLAPIWLALPEEQRGTFYVHNVLLPHASDLGIDTARVGMPTGGLTVVASYGDLKSARRHSRRCILSEHGAGQTYVGTESGSYLGAPDRAQVAAVLVPGDMQAAVHRAAHPDIPAYVVGCPKLDHQHRAPAKPLGTPPVVAVSFHWDAASIAPEARGAFQQYRPHLPRLAREFPSAIGHAHPRLFHRIQPSFRRSGLRPVKSFAEVMDRADCYVVDNSSTLYEFASLDRPVVVLNHPRYRRDVEHGLRFWSHADVGVQVDDPADLIDAVTQALQDPAHVAARRREIVSDVYVACDGNASARAVTAVLEVHDRERVTA